MASIAHFVRAGNSSGKIENSNNPELLLAMNAEIGLEYDPTATAEESRRPILADGVLPEDNLFSCGIISARNEE